MSFLVQTPITAVATVDEGRPVTYFVTGAASASGNVITLSNAGTVKVDCLRCRNRRLWLRIRYKDLYCD